MSQNSQIKPVFQSFSLKHFLISVTFSTQVASALLVKSVYISQLIYIIYVVICKITFNYFAKISFIENVYEIVFLLFEKNNL